MGAFTTYASHDYMDTYFGVSAADQLFGGLSIGYRFTIGG